MNNNLLLVVVSCFNSVLSKPSCYQTQAGECLQPLTQGHCQEDEWLVFTNERILECKKKACGNETALVNGECVVIEDKKKCHNLGEALFFNIWGNPTCHCKIGWLRENRMRNPNKVWGDTNIDFVVKSGGKCIQEFTRGDCPTNMMIKFSEDGIAGCIRNPCGDSTKELPHYTTWHNSSNFTCHKVKTFQTAGDSEENLVVEKLDNCEVVVDRDDDTLTCENWFSVNNVLNTPCLSEKCCVKGEVFSKFRNQCVRQFIIYD